MSQAIASTPSAPRSAVPTLSSPGQRIDSLDLLRGIAILGIFVMNTWTMSLPQEAYTNPAAYANNWIIGYGFPGGSTLQPPTGAEFWDYALIHLTADMKFITMFSIMFGAGIVLQSERSARKGHNPWLVHYLRMFVLLIFGLIHTFGFWYGDILTDYSMAGMLLAPLRKLRPGLLMLLGMMMIASVTLIDEARRDGWLRESTTWHVGPVNVTIPGVIGDLENFENDVRFHFERHADAYGNEYNYPNDMELDTYRGTTVAETGGGRLAIWWSEITGHRFATSVIDHSAEFIFWVLPRCGGCFLIGMALHKRKFFQGDWSKAAYASIAGIATIVGWMVTAVGIQFNTHNGWNEDWTNYFSLWHLGVEFNYWGSLLCTFGYMCFGVLLAAWAADPQRRILRACLIPFRAVGRMALTCYLAETLIGTTIFYGHGLGLFGYLSRPALLPIVFATWGFIMVFATVWLSYFRQGPLEWFWHSLVYMEWRNPLRSASGPDAVPEGAG